MVFKHFSAWEEFILCLLWQGCVNLEQTKNFSMLRLMAFHAIDILFSPVVKILADSEVLDLNKKL